MASRTIDPRYVPQAVTVPPNTAIATPTTVKPGFGSVLLELLEVYIPPGHNGLTGLAVIMGGVHVVPYGDNTAWIVGNTPAFPFELGFEAGTDLTVATYNTDLAYSHTFYLRWKLRSIAATASDMLAVPSNVTVLPIAAGASS